MLINKCICFQCLKIYNQPSIFQCSYCLKPLCYDCYSENKYLLCNFCNYNLTQIYKCNFCNSDFKQKLNLNNFNPSQMKQLCIDYLGVIAFKLHSKYICRKCLFIDNQIISNYREKNHYNCKFCGTFSTRNNKYVFKCTIKFLCKNGLYNYKKFFLCEKHISNIKKLEFKTIDYDHDNNQWCQKKILKKCESHNCNKLIRNNLFFCNTCTYKIIKIQKWWKSKLISKYNLLCLFS